MTSKSHPSSLFSVLEVSICDILLQGKLSSLHANGVRICVTKQAPNYLMTGLVEKSS